MTTDRPANDRAADDSRRTGGVREARVRAAIVDLVDAIEVNALEVNAIEVNAIEVHAIEVQAIEANVIDANAIEVNAMEASDIDARAALPRDERAGRMPGSTPRRRPASTQVSSGARRRRRSGFLAGLLAAVVVVLAVLVMPTASNRTSSPAAGVGGPQFPPELPAYRIWRLSQQMSPLNDVAVSYVFNPDHDFGFLDAPHQVLLGGDLSTIRHFDVSSRPITLVSPDGRRLASHVGDTAYFDTHGQDAQIRLDDLRAGTHTTARIPRDHPRGDVELIAWSPDATRLYALGQPEIDTSKPPVPDLGNRLWEISLDGQVREVPGTRQAQGVAAAPDGIGLAVVRPDGRVDVVDRRDGRVLASPVGPSGLRPLAQIDQTELRRRDPYLATEVQHQSHAPVTAMWSPSGVRLVALEDQSPEHGTGLGVLSGAWEGTVLRTVDRSGASRVLRLGNYHCRPLAMLSETSLLCESGTTTAADPEAGRRMTTLDLETGDRRVVARYPRIDNGVWWTRVAADLARTWRFSMSQPWADPGSSEELWRR